MVRCKNIILMVFMAFLIGCVHDYQNQSTNEQAQLIRKWQEKTINNLYKVQDFDFDGNKLTDPYFIKDPADLIVKDKKYKQADYKYAIPSNIYNNLSIDGPLTTYYPKGQAIFTKVNYLNGTLVGNYSLYYETGNKFKEIIYENNNEKQVTAWSRAGVKIFESLIEEDNKIQKSYYHNGVKSSESHFRNNGILFERWDKEGNKIDRITNNDHVYFNINREIIKKNKDGTFLVQDKYKNGNKRTDPYILINKKDAEKLRDYDLISIDGSLVIYDQNGNRIHQLEYSQGLRNGLSITWSPDDGQKMLEIEFKMGLKDGLYIQWLNAQKIIEGKYKNDEKVGLWTYWNKDGNKTTEVYWTTNGDKSRTIKYDKQGNIIEEIKEDTNK